MIERSTSVRPPQEAKQRLLGDYTSGLEGPVFMFVGGIHGNEPSGLIAVRRVLAQLEALKIRIFGHVRAIAGNLGALESRERYLDMDLNRQWRSEHLEALRRKDPAQDSREEAELRDLLDELEKGLLLESTGVVLIDLHTSSAQGPPFVIMADTLQNRRIAAGLPIPTILGLEENLDGTMLGYFGRHGYVALAVEGGFHDAPTTFDHHEAAIWLALVAGGALEAADVPDYAQHRARLAQAARGLPPVVETRYRHALEDGHDFRMEPGFDTFHAVSKGELLATEGTQPIHAQEDGLLMLPLYQGQGNDGFFLGRPVGRTRLFFSALVRRLRLDLFLRLLPGIRRHRDEPDSLIADLHVARFYAAEIFNIFGYRGRRVSEGQMLFIRRREGRRD